MNNSQRPYTLQVMKNQAALNTKLVYCQKILKLHIRAFHPLYHSHTVMSQAFTTVQTKAFHEKTSAYHVKTKGSLMKNQIEFKTPKNESLIISKTLSTVQSSILAFQTSLTASINVVIV